MKFLLSHSPVILTVSAHTGICFSVYLRGDSQRVEEQGHQTHLLLDVFHTSSLALLPCSNCVFVCQIYKHEMFMNALTPVHS